MDKQTLLKLKNNPHYKLTDKQKALLASFDRKPMVEFGTVKKNSNKFDKHDTETKKVKRVKGSNG